MFYTFNSIFWVQFYARGTSVIMGINYYHIVLNFCQMNSVFFLGGGGGGRVFLEFCFPESILLGVLSVAKYFWGISEIPNSADPCL